MTSDRGNLIKVMPLANGRSQLTCECGWSLRCDTNLAFDLGQSHRRTAHADNDVTGGVWYCPACKKPCSYKVSTCSNCAVSVVDSPTHYTDGPVPGMECIEVAKWFNFALGNVIKYVWRCDQKGKPIEDLEKAAAYLRFEIERRRAAS